MNPEQQSNLPNNTPQESVPGQTPDSQPTQTPDVAGVGAPEAGTVISGTNTIAPQNTEPTIPTADGQLGSPALGATLPPPKSSKKKLLLGAGAALLVVVLAGAWVLASYLPNRPNAVWATGLARTGKAIDSIVQKASDKDKLAKLTKSEMSGDFSYDDGDNELSGDYSTSFDDKKSDNKLDISSKSSSGEFKDLKLGAKVITILGDKATYPDIYVNISGFSSLGFDSFLPGINAYDGKWIKIDSTKIESIVSAEDSKDDSKQSQITSADIAELTNTASGLAREYVFSADPDKNVIDMKSFVGKETTDGIGTYHYVAAINKAHAKDFCQALADKLVLTNAVKKLEPEQKDRDGFKKSFSDGCKDSVNDLKSDDTFDVWIDSHYKLIHKVRFVGSDNKKSYVELGQTYKGGKELNLFANYHDDSDGVNGKVTVTLNADTFTGSGSFSFKSTNKAVKFDTSGHFTIKASDGHVDVTAPAGAISIDEVMKQLGIPSDLFSTKI